jgi:hypothetical protein
MMLSSREIKRNKINFPPQKKPPGAVRGLWWWLLPEEQLKKLSVSYPHPDRGEDPGVTKSLNCIVLFYHV